MRISFVTTVLNEEQEIEKFLKSLFAQSKFPDEIIIVDGGSSDQTIAKIRKSKSEIRNKKINFQIIIKNGNRSVGRNEAIRQSTGEIITCSDVGCILDKNWLKYILEPFRDSNVDVASGYYKPINKSIFEDCLATYTCVMTDRVDKKNFLPSSRSIAFRKTAWGKVGGYPERLDTCEDLVFAKKMKKMGFTFHFAGNAIVYWPQRKNLKEAFWQFFNYAVGDGQARYFRPQTPFLLGRYLFGVLLLILFLMSKQYYILNTIYLILTFYIVWSVLKNYKYVRHPKAFLYLPALQIVSDAAVLSGMTIGFLKSFAR